MRALEHRTDQPLEREEDQYDGEDQDCELEDLPDESYVTPVAREQPENPGNRDCGQRQKQEEANEDHVPKPRCAAFDVASHSRPVAFRVAFCCVQSCVLLLSCAQLCSGG